MKDERQRTKDETQGRKGKAETASSFILHPSSFPATGLLGGSFNPPHIAHVLVAAWALASGEVGEVWVFPSGGHPFGKELAPFDDRMEMCRRAFACFGPRARVLDLERPASGAPRVHYSIDTLRALAAAHPDRRWRWIMGSDTLAEADRWREFDALTRLAPPLVVPRAGHERPTSPVQGRSGLRPDKDTGAGAGGAGSQSHLSDVGSQPRPTDVGSQPRPTGASGFALPDLSATFIRERLAAGAHDDLAGLLPWPVLDWIRGRGLYRAGGDDVDDRSHPSIGKRR
jgi:nicotinate-nucleotide adenylyltransferase